MALSRLELIFILGLSALVLRALPQLFLVGKSFPTPTSIPVTALLVV